MTTFVLKPTADGFLLHNSETDKVTWHSSVESACDLMAKWKEAHPKC